MLGIKPSTVRAKLPVRKESERNHQVSLYHLLEYVELRTFTPPKARR